MVQTKWNWCPDKKHRLCRIERQRCPTGHGVRWAYIVSYFNNADDWNVWIVYDDPCCGRKARY